MGIPKLAHWIWMGSELPKWARANLETFSALHPGWESIVWRDLPDRFPTQLREIIDQTPWYSSRSDIFRYWILAEFGGVFLDTDIVCLRHFGPFLINPFFLAPCQPEGHHQPHLNCALMGSEQGSPAISAVLEECVHYAAQEAPPKRIAFGPDLLTRLFSGGMDSVKILPEHYFYAIPDRATAHRFWQGNPSERSQILAGFRESFIDDQEPYAVHLWGVDGSSWRTINDARCSA